MHVTGWGSQESEVQAQQVDTPGPVTTHFLLPRRLPAAGDAAAVLHLGASKERQRHDPATGGSWCAPHFRCQKDPSPHSQCPVGFLSHEAKAIPTG